MTARSQPLGVELLFDRLCKRCKQRNTGNADYHVLRHELWLDVNPIAPSRFSFISRCFFCKNYKADSDVQAPFLVAESRLPSEFTGGMLILFQLDHRHPEFHAQVSGSFTPVVSGRLRLDSPRRCPVLTEITPRDYWSPLQRISAINSVGELDSLCSFTVWEQCQYLFISRPTCFFKFTIEVPYYVSTKIRLITFLWRLSAGQK